MVKQHSTLENTVGVNGPMSLHDGTCLCGWKRGAGCALLAISIKPDQFNTMPCTHHNLLFELTPPWPLLPCHLFYPLSAQISATTKRGCRPWAGSPWGPGNWGADFLLPLPPPPTEMGRDQKQTPPPSMPPHPHCRPAHGERGPSPRGKGADAE